jgi:hypothetical protein
MIPIQLPLIKIAPPVDAATVLHWTLQSFGNRGGTLPQSVMKRPVSVQPIQGSTKEALINQLQWC